MLTQSTSAHDAPGHLDVVEKIKKEGAGYQAKHHAMRRPFSPPAPSYSGSTRYDYATSTAGDPPFQNGVKSPVASRRDADDLVAPPTSSCASQSLPSLAEALGSRPALSRPPSPRYGASFRSPRDAGTQHETRSYPPHDHHHRVWDRPPSRHATGPYHQTTYAASSPHTYGPADRYQPPAHLTQAPQPSHTVPQSPSAWASQHYASYDTRSHEPSTKTHGPSYPNSLSQSEHQNSSHSPFVTSYPAQSNSSYRSSQPDQYIASNFTDQPQHPQFHDSVKRHLDTFNYEASLNEVCHLDC